MLRILTPVFALGLLALSSQSAQAYCIYNHTDGWDLRVKQMTGGNFSAEPNGKGARACCPWDTMSCNSTLQRTGVVTIWVQGWKGREGPEGNVQGMSGSCGTIPSTIDVQAGGWIEIYSGSDRADRDRAFHCIAYGADGKVTSVVTK
ncbi:MAG TPA: hypothetical protein VD995_06155 [Azospirillum sp.]|nr:hypothetical protein [Azospirillum sp.]